MNLVDRNGRPMSQKKWNPRLTGIEELIAMKKQKGGGPVVRREELDTVLVYELNRIKKMTLQNNESINKVMTVLMQLISSLEKEGIDIGVTIKPSGAGKPGAREGAVPNGEQVSSPSGENGQVGVNPNGNTPGCSRQDARTGNTQENSRP